MRATECSPAPRCSGSLLAAGMTAQAAAPKDATGQCTDGGYTAAKTQEKGCLKHGGVKTWFGGASAAGATSASAAGPAPRQSPRDLRSARPGYDLLEGRHRPEGRDRPVHRRQLYDAKRRRKGAVGALAGRVLRGGGDLRGGRGLVGRCGGLSRGRPGRRTGGGSRGGGSCRCSAEPALHAPVLEAPFLLRLRGRIAAVGALAGRVLRGRGLRGHAGRESEPEHRGAGEHSGSAHGWFLGGESDSAANRAGGWDEPFTGGSASDTPLARGPADSQPGAKIVPARGREGGTGEVARDFIRCLRRTGPARAPGDGVAPGHGRPLSQRLARRHQPVQPAWAMAHAARHQPDVTEGLREVADSTVFPCPTSSASEPPNIAGERDADRTLHAPAPTSPPSASVRTRSTGGTLFQQTPVPRQG